MNYLNTYNAIVIRAQHECNTRQQLKKNGEYFELHHIIPKSLGGSNLINNLVLLTAREHFICHWLLVKIYPRGSDAFGKMLYAFWRMQSINDIHRRYIYSRAYDYLRKDFADRIGQLTSVTQSGELNSQYGKTWYTNYETGISKPFIEKPDGKWVKGRNVFNGQTSSLMYLLIGSNNGVPPKYKNKHRSMHNKIELKALSIQKARYMWNEFHDGNYKSLNEYAKQVGVSRVSVYNWFKKYIPKFKECCICRTVGFSSNKDFVDVYE